VTNMHADQRTVLRVCLAGFEFESNKNEQVQFLATAGIGGEVQASWEALQRLMTAEGSGDEAAIELRHAQRLQRLEEQVIAKPPKSGIPVSVKAGSSGRLGVLQQYLSAVSTKSALAKNSQLKQNVNR
jgi:hypothetical protein